MTALDMMRVCRVCVGVWCVVSNDLCDFTCALGLTIPSVSAGEELTQQQPEKIHARNLLAKKSSAPVAPLEKEALPVTASRDQQNPLVDHQQPIPTEKQIDNDDDNKCTTTPPSIKVVACYPSDSVTPSLTVDSPVQTWPLPVTPEQSNQTIEQTTTTTMTTNVDTKSESSELLSNRSNGSNSRSPPPALPMKKKRKQKQSALLTLSIQTEEHKSPNSVEPVSSPSPTLLNLPSTPTVPVLDTSSLQKVRPAPARSSSRRSSSRLKRVHDFDSSPHALEHQPAFIEASASSAGAGINRPGTPIVPASNLIAARLATIKKSSKKKIAQSAMPGVEAAAFLDLTGVSGRTSLDSILHPVVIPPNDSSPPLASSSVFMPIHTDVILDLPTNLKGSTTTTTTATLRSTWDGQQQPTSTALKEDMKTAKAVNEEKEEEKVGLTLINKTQSPLSNKVLESNISPQVSTFIGSVADVVSYADDDVSNVVGVDEEVVIFRRKVRSDGRPRGAKWNQQRRQQTQIENTPTLEMNKTLADVQLDPIIHALPPPSPLSPSKEHASVPTQLQPPPKLNLTLSEVFTLALDSNSFTQSSCWNPLAEPDDDVVKLVVPKESSSLIVGTKLLEIPIQIEQPKSIIPIETTRTSDEHIVKKSQTPTVPGVMTAPAVQSNSHRRLPPLAPRTSSGSRDILSLVKKAILPPPPTTTSIMPGDLVPISAVEVVQLILASNSLDSSNDWPGETAGMSLAQFEEYRLSQTNDHELEKARQSTVLSLLQAGRLDGTILSEVILPPPSPMMTPPAKIDLDDQPASERQITPIDLVELATPRVDEPGVGVPSIRETSMMRVRSLLRDARLRATSHKLTDLPLLSSSLSTSLLVDRSHHRPTEVRPTLTPGPTSLQTNVQPLRPLNIPRLNFQNLPEFSGIEHKEESKLIDTTMRLFPLTPTQRRCEDIKESHAEEEDEKDHRHDDGERKEEAHDGDNDADDEDDEFQPGSARSKEVRTKIQPHGSFIDPSSKDAQTNLPSQVSIPLSSHPSSSLLSSPSFSSSGSMSLACHFPTHFIHDLSGPSGVFELMCHKLRSTLEQTNRLTTLRLWTSRTMGEQESTTLVMRVLDILVPSSSLIHGRRILIDQLDLASVCSATVLRGLFERLCYFDTNDDSYQPGRLVLKGLQIRCDFLEEVGVDGGTEKKKSKEQLAQLMKDAFVTSNCLERLDLMNSDLGSIGLIQLLRCLNGMKRLRSLGLGSLKLGGGGGGCSSSSSSQSVSRKGCQFLLETLGRTQSLEKIDLSMNELTDMEMIFIVQGIFGDHPERKVSNKLIELHLGMNRFTHVGLTQLFTSLSQVRQPSLRVLSLDFLPFGPSSNSNTVVDTLCHFLSSSSCQLTSLNLHQCHIDLEGLNQIARAIRLNKNLTTINLAENLSTMMTTTMTARTRPPVPSSSSSSSIECFLEELCLNTSLKILDLRDNSFMTHIVTSYSKKKDGWILFSCLKQLILLHTRLEVLHISGNGLQRQQQAELNIELKKQIRRRDANSQPTIGQVEAVPPHKETPKVPPLPLAMAVSKPLRAAMPLSLPMKQPEAHKRPIASPAPTRPMTASDRAIKSVAANGPSHVQSSSASIVLTQRFGMKSSPINHAAAPLASNVKSIKSNSIPTTTTPNKQTNKSASTTPKSLSLDVHPPLVTVVPGGMPIPISSDLSSSLSHARSLASIGSSGGFASSSMMPLRSFQSSVGRPIQAKRIPTSRSIAMPVTVASSMHGVVCQPNPTPPTRPKSKNVTPRKSHRSNLNSFTDLTRIGDGEVDALVDRMVPRLDQLFPNGLEAIGRSNTMKKIDSNNSKFNPSFASAHAHVPGIKYQVERR